MAANRDKTAFSLGEICRPKTRIFCESLITRKYNFKLFVSTINLVESGEDFFEILTGK